MGEQALPLVCCAIAGEQAPAVTRVEELAMSLSGCSAWERQLCTSPVQQDRAVLGWGVAGEWAPVHENRRASSLTSSDASQYQMQCFELTHPKIYLIYELTACIKG